MENILSTYSILYIFGWIVGYVGKQTDLLCHLLCLLLILTALLPATSFHTSSLYLVGILKIDLNLAFGYLGYLRPHWE